jgi:hypothetical protein
MRFGKFAVPLIAAISFAACSNGDTAAAAIEATGAVEAPPPMPISDAPPPDGSLEEFVEWFVRSLGYEEQDVTLMDSAIERLLVPLESGAPLVPGGDITPLGKAVLVVEARDRILPRARYRIRYGSATVESPESAGRLPLSFIQVDRFSLETAVADSYRRSADAPVWISEQDSSGPHVSYRLITYPLQGGVARLLAVSRREIADTIADRDVCNGAPCMQPSPAAEQVAPWEVMEEVGSDFVTSYERTRHGMLAPAAALELAAVELGAAWLDQGRVEWRGFEERESVIPGLSFVEAVIETGLGQDDAVEVYVREGDVMDDDVLAVWQRIVSLPQAAGAPMATYGARSYERRGRP